MSNILDVLTNYTSELLGGNRARVPNPFLPSLTSKDYGGEPVPAALKNKVFGGRACSSEPSQAPADPAPGRVQPRAHTGRNGFAAGPQSAPEDRRAAGRPDTHAPRPVLDRSVLSTLRRIQQPLLLDRPQQAGVADHPAEPGLSRCLGATRGRPAGDRPLQPARDDAPGRRS